MFDNKVWKTLVLITQVGLSILVPIFFLVWIGVIIKNKFSVDLILFLLILGVLVSIRNAYKLIKPFIE